jgi:hypothetical protein
MNMTEVESALIALSAAHPSICELITLPHPTIEGRTTHAVRLGTPPANTVDAYYLTGGVHAREWGSSEILVNLATDLCDAYAGGTGIAYGGKYFSAAEVKALMEQTNIIVFPCVNPDGRHYSQNTYALWRKNRNTADSGGDPAKIGIDINGYLASTDPSVDTYHGSSPASEPETQNINYIHDTYTRIKWYVDVHSYSEDILYVWGDDEIQLTDTSKTFTNPAFNGQRGLLADGYSEYMPDSDLSRLQALAHAFTASLAEVRGKTYVAKPGYSLYATSGTNDDYAFSRHITDPSKSKALSFTVEWGAEFQPPWTEMQEIIKDVSAGLIGLGLEALGIDSFIVANRDTFSSYEVETTLDYPESLYVIYDGFTPTSLSVPGASPSVQFLTSISGGVISSISATLNSVHMEDPGSPGVPQRISFTYDVHFTDGSAFTTETRDIVVRASFAGLQDVAPVRLIKQPNPYMVDGPVSWLSTDVRVFQLRPGQTVNAASGVTLQNPDTNANAPFAYIQGLLTELRSVGNSPAPPFENIPQDAESSELELSRTVGGVRVLNFAVAKVRYRANTQDAVDVRVFFRTFNTMVSDLSYTTNPAADVQNYRRKSDGTISLLGKNRFFSGTAYQILSIPYFAEPRVNTATQSMTAQTDTWNRQTLVHAGSQEAIQYFGCWLDFNQTESQFPGSPPSADGPFSGRLPIVQLVRGIHQCLVAEIRYQPGATDPVPNGATPSSSDRLAQRNLAIVESDNPGTAATHTVQHTVLLKPSSVPVAKGVTAATVLPTERSQYDELVIRWNDLPRDTLASLYFPDWNADEIIELASRRPGPTSLTKIDPATIACPVGDITYIPIPHRVRDPIPGLITLQLPLTVREGDRFTLDVQQHSGPTLRRTSRQHGAEGSSGEVNASLRKVLGAFRVTVAVKVGEPLLGKAVRNLAVLKYILQAIPPSSSWHPVFVRYIGQLGDQVGDLGVDPELVPVSADDPGIPVRPYSGEVDCQTGKIAEVIFDCFGDFQGFALETCDGRFRYASREKGIAELVLRACRERLTISVCVKKASRERIHEIIVRCGDPC